MDNELRKKMGARIRSAREQKGLLQSELASKCGVTPQAVSSWESGRTEPKYAMLLTICATLGVTPFDVVPTPLTDTLPIPSVGSPIDFDLDPDWGDWDEPSDDMYSKLSEKVDTPSLSDVLTEDEIEFIEMYRKASQSAKLKAYAELVKGAL